MHVVYQLRCIFHYTKCMAGVQFVLSLELPRTSEQTSAILIITVSNFISLLKGTAEKTTLNNFTSTVSLNISHYLIFITNYLVLLKSAQHEDLLFFFFFFFVRLYSS